MQFADLSGKTALITGSSRGIGKDIAKSFIDAGASVIICASREETAKKVAEELNAHSYVGADLSDIAGLEEFAKRVGDVDILVNNAGITEDGLFMRQSDEAWDNVLDVNLNSAVKLTKLFMPAMSKKRWGRIINVTSVVAHMGNNAQTNYVASKAAMTGFSKALSKEMARRGVTVNCVAPGFIETDMTEKLDDAVKANFIKNIPAAKFGTGEDIANAVRFLASDAAGYMTGTTLHVNGGLYV
ncbi:MAG: 3-oxoacyl-ACP reductase FabG [Pseudomonadota bacterium]|nr:3-oxoacyl-ACP reductase FabG [Pseudomonadota bacterium]